MKEIIEYLTENQAELLFENDHFVAIKLKNYADHWRIGTIASQLERLLPNRQSILFVQEPVTNDIDDFCVAFKDNSRSFARECLCHKFGGSYLNLWWYGYINDRTPGWQAINQDVTPEDIIEYLQRFWK